MCVCVCVLKIILFICSEALGYLSMPRFNALNLSYFQKPSASSEALIVANFISHKTSYMMAPSQPFDWLALHKTSRTVKKQLIKWKRARLSALFVFCVFHQTCEVSVGEP